MIRTQISLDEDAYNEAKAEARRRSISLAEFLRRSVAVALNERGRQRKPWMRYAGTVASGDPRASRSVNEVVYGRPRP
ncbi:MAG TPA: CopG family transcriptional regulator [Thermoanaerobaculia bacterium]|nr:CopG family transcriptional regulator [Thermoanaerobaculia bacterium]